MANEIQALRDAVARNTDTTQSAIALVQGLKTQLDAAIASGDMSQVQALADQLGQNDVALATAVQENTPRPTPPTPTPEPAPQAGQRTPATGQQPDNDGGQVQR